MKIYRASEAKALHILGETNPTKLVLLEKVIVA
jgi:hypothetical protein